MLLGLLSISTFQKTKSFNFPIEAAEITITALAPFMWYLHHKESEMNPAEDAITNSKHKNFWTKSNLWKLFDQKIIGQRFKPKSEKVGDRKLKFDPKDCWPTGVLGNFDSYAISIGKLTAKSLVTIYSILLAQNPKKLLKALK